MKNGQHVVPYGTDWAVRRAGSDRVTSVHSTQAAAYDAGRDIARNQATEVFLHGRDGRIRDRESFGNDPRSSHDTKH
ncbi:MAG: DUF2188 domain-containing protein [Patescibacteria group bacterium]